MHNLANSAANRWIVTPDLQTRSCLPRLAVCVAALITLALMWCPNKAVAQVLTLTLEGETFQNADAKNSKVGCLSDTKGSRIEFFISGLAVGPFPGTFNESGSLTFDPVSGLITGGDIKFDISNEKGPISGTKTALAGKASCNVDPRTGIVTINASVTTLEYKADVHGFPDAGQAVLFLTATIDPAFGLVTLQFTEIFHSSNVVRSTLGKITGGGNIEVGGGNGVTLGFNAQNTENGMKGSGTIIDHNAGIRVKILDVKTFSIVGTHATFTGTAEVNGVVEKYQIDVDDLGEPGTGLDSFKVVTDSYGSGGTLSGGNIQVHK